jgi:hypothetical protein
MTWRLQKTEYGTLGIYQVWTTRYGTFTKVVLHPFNEKGLPGSAVTVWRDDQ